MPSQSVFILAQAAPGGSEALWMNLVPMIAIFAIFYFLLIAPMRRRQKKLQELVEGLKRGDRVVTTGGIYGEVAAVEPGIIHLKIADNTKIRVAKSAIGGLATDPEAGGTR